MSCQGDVCAACMTIPPVTGATYNPKGQTLTLASDLPVYITGSSGVQRGIIMVYDIFGLHPNAYQLADKLAEAGFQVAMPDFFRGKPWSLEKFPPADRSELLSWIGGYTYEGHIKPDMDKAVAALRERGVTKFGALGFCWGGKMSTLASRDTATYSATASPHPSFLNNDDAALVGTPILLLPSKDEADLTEFIDRVKARGLPASQVKFDDMHHGWTAARGDWTVAEQAARATEAIQLLAQFFTEHLK